MRASRTALILALVSGLDGCATNRVDTVEVPYIDAHSHIVSSMTPDEEIARFRRAGLAGVAIMHPDPEALQDIAARNPGYVIPFISAARTPEMRGFRLGEDTASHYAALQAAGATCGFGEIPTRLVPNPDPSDDIALTNRFRWKIYDLANARGMAVNVHVSLETPQVIAAAERIARAHPNMKLVLAHAGWVAGADVIGRLMAAHPNIYADLSVRLDPVAGWSAPGTTGPAVSNGISILDANGSLQPAWRTLLERFPDRFLFAMDITGADRPEQLEALLATAKVALGALPINAQHAIAHGNFERLVRGCKMVPRR
jgi:predicted TIM-barrel fold metal-dependent hydrolase